MTTGYQPSVQVGSKLPEILDSFQAKLQQVDAFERRLEEKVAEKRVRALNILDELPAHRSSTLRIYVTHQFHQATTYVPVETPVPPVAVTPAAVTPSTTTSIDPVTGATIIVQPQPAAQPQEEIVVDVPKKEIKVNKWNTIIEGKLLVSQLDHQSSATMEQASKAVAEREGRTYQTQNDSEAMDTSDMTSRERTATRFMHDREGEEAIVPIKFGHFFDRISVTFETYQKDIIEKNEGQSESFSKSPAAKRSKRSSISPKAKAKAKKKQAPTPEPIESYEITGKKTLFWNRQRAGNPNVPNALPQSAMDTPAFHAFYTEESEPLDKENTVVATIRFHRKELREKYKPSSVLCNVLLPFLCPPKKDVEVQSSQGQGVVVAPPEENDVQVPTLLTMDEALGAIDFYIRQKALWDENDVSLIRNDGKLEELFGCKEMTMAETKQLLVSRGLLIPSILGTPGDAPVVLKYIMKKETALNSNIDLDGNSENGEVTDAGPNDNDGNEEGPVSKKRKAASVRDDKSDVDEAEPNILSCDIDIDVVHLYHSKCRDILRRVKIREYEYTSCRTRALRTVEQTKAQEDVIKERLENIVRQKGLTIGHQPILAALAKEAPEGSEARIVAHLDSRTALLVDRLETHCQHAHACWDMVDKCRG